MTVIQFRLVEREWRAGDSYFVPIVTATLEGLDESYSALIDTGAAVSIVDSALLLALGYTDEEIRAGEPVDLGGVTGAPSELHGWLHDLTIVLGDGPRLTLRDIRCVVCADAADVILLGQQQALEALVFLQHGIERTGELRDL